MAKAHEINLGTTAFNQLTNRDYIVLLSENISVGDYILFKQVETIEGETVETGLSMMTHIKDIVKSEGLKDGYSILVVNKL